MVKIQIPNDFSDEVVGRNCEGEFPEWEIPDENINGGYMEFSTEPDICKNCPHINGCRMLISSILLMPELIGDKSDFNAMSSFFALMGQRPDFGAELLDDPRIIDGDFDEIIEGSKLIEKED